MRTQYRCLPHTKISLMLRRPRALLVALMSLSLCCVAPAQGYNAMASGRRDVDVFPGIGKYIFQRTEMSWNDALQACRGKGGSLAIIDTPEEGEILKGLLQKYGATSIHLGFHNLYKDDTFVTIEGKDVSPCTSQWARGYPQQRSAKTCGGLCLTGIINHACSKPQQSICELWLSSDYDLIPGVGFYRYHTEALTWPEAWQACRAEGTHLIVVYSEGEYNVIKAKYPSKSPVWVGAHRIYGSPVTIFDEPVSSTGFNKWVKQVGDYAAYPYVEMQYSGANGGFNAEQPNARRPFICERRIHLY